MIRLIDVHKSFGSKTVLEGFTLDVDEGETTVIIGYSGSGKSVAIKHIVGLLEPDSGTVWVDGKEVPKLSRPELYALRSKVGYVFQFAALFDSMSIGDNVAMGLRKEHQLSEPEIAQRVTEALALVDLPGVESRYPAELSGGMRKRIVITHDMRSAYTVGSRIAMLYEGKVRQVGTVEEIKHTKDPIVCQFIEGRPSLDLAGAGV